MNEIQRVAFNELLHELTRVLLSVGLGNDAAQQCARVFTENTCDGVPSHGLNRFPSFVSDVKAGIVKTHVSPERVNALGAIEQWDGKRGIGILNASTAMNRAIELSRIHGIGCVGLRNTNHWMRAGTYGLLAAEAGCIGICWTNTVALMPPWGSATKKIGNNPLVVCIPHAEGPVLLDMAMSQFSMGKLASYRRSGDDLPLAGGYDENGKLTTDPNAVLKSGNPLPIGYWKGSGLAFVLDLMATIIADGDSTREITQRGGETGVSQVFMAIDIISRMGASHVEDKVNAIIQDFLEAPAIEGTQKVRFPGQGMLSERKTNLEKGIPVDLQFWQTIKQM
jgi:3-dehydro-L-gulonate 2-dehydrogenase